MDATFPSLPIQPQPLHFKSHTLKALLDGPKLIVLGAVHGNEVAGTQAILKVLAEFERGDRLLHAGQVTFVPVTNPLAYNRQQRNGDRNLNRNLTPTATPQDFEDHVANWLCPLLAQHDVLLDIHTFQKGEVPFALFGPPNNRGALQPFQHEQAERALAKSLGVTRFVDGWLDTYAQGVEHRLQFLKRNGLSGEGLSTDSRYGIGTTECMRASGGYAVTLECGQHQAPQAPFVAYEAIINTLLHLGLIEGEPVKQVEAYQHLRLLKVVDKEHGDDRFVRTWSSFDAVSQGELIGVRANGEEVLSPFDGFIVFPNVTSAVGQEWFYMAQQQHESF